MTYLTGRKYFAKIFNTLPNYIRAVENKHEFLKILEELL